MTFQYWFINLYTMYPDSRRDDYGMNQRTVNTWRLLYVVNKTKFETAHVLQILHTLDLSL